MNALLLLVLGFPLLAHAGIYGEDSREEFHHPSVPAIVRLGDLSALSNGDFQSKAWDLSEVGLCRDARFFGQKSLASCSAVLVGPDLILTAGHCVQPGDPTGCQQRVVVFDYAAGRNEDIIPAVDVYHCVEIVYQHQDTRESGYGEDLALIKLDRVVVGRKPMKLAKQLPSKGELLKVIGYPWGIPQKVSEGHMLGEGPARLSFRHDVDTFSKSSGGPVLNAKGEVAGIMVRDLAPEEKTMPKGSHCIGWGVAGPNDYAEATSVMHLRQYTNSR